MKNQSVAVFINRFLPIIGGSELQAFNLYRKLVSDHQVDVKIFTFKPEAVLSNEVIEGIKVKRVGRANFNSWITRKVNFIVLLLTLLVEIKGIDVLDIRSPKSLHSLLAIYIAQKFGKKTIIRFATDGDFEALMEGIEGIKFSWVKYKVNYFIAINSDISKAINDSGIEEEKIILLPNTVDTNKFKPPVEEEKQLLRKKNNLDKKAIYVLFVGRLVKRKGIDLLLDVWIKILKNNVEQDLKLLIIGEGGDRKDSIENLLLAKANHLDKNNSVVFLGKKENVWEYYKCADIFVFPSRREGSPNVVIEAMATGLPVVTTKLPGTKDIIKDKENGILIDIDDKDRLENEIYELISDKKNRMQLGKAARRFVETELSLSKAIDVYMEILNN